MSEIQLLLCHLLRPDMALKQLALLQPQTEDQLSIFVLFKCG